MSNSIIWKADFNQRHSSDSHFRHLVKKGRRPTLRFPTGFLDKLNFKVAICPRMVHTEKNLRSRTISAFLKLCAGRIGQLLNLSSLANECGISHTAAKSWISVLEASFIVFLLRPHHENFNKRLVKMPKPYFYDPGIALYLLDIRSVEQIQTHYAKGVLFESLIISELKTKIQS